MLVEFQLQLILRALGDLVGFATIVFVAAVDTGETAAAIVGTKVVTKQNYGPKVKPGLSFASLNVLFAYFLGGIYQHIIQVLCTSYA